MAILENIRGHEDLTRLQDEERLALCRELRTYLVDHVAQTGGHLASNLGAVELTVAIETVFHTMQDRLVFDVGHQSYVHKLLTGRQADFADLRQFGGISGFPKPEESPSDAFVAGHASSSVSIALGMARARTLLKQDYHVVALLGDGAATGGMIYEGLNDAAESREPMVIILNDNEMSIDRNVGGMSRHLSRLRTKPQYLGAKMRYRRFMYRLPGGKPIYRFTKRMKDRLKRMLLPSTIFENMGLTYLGPVDGHDVNGLIRVLKTAKMLDTTVLVHVVTKKGCGYGPAEEDPSKFHGIGKFEPLSGQPLGSSSQSFSSGFGQQLITLAREDKRICAITAAMPSGTGLLDFQKEFPERTFDVGIAEEHAVSMAGGLAKQGMIPVVAIYSTFLQRAFDQIIQDVALLGLHVVFAVDRAGLVGEDGPTHHGVFDVGFLRQIPGVQILCPASIAEQQQMLTWAVKECQGPVVIRYPRGGNGGFTDYCWDASQPEQVICHRRGGDITLLTYGKLINNVMDAAEILSRQGIEATVLRLPMATNADIAGICRFMAPGGKLIVAEEVCRNSGIYQELSHALGKISRDYQVYGVDLGHRFCVHGSTTKLYEHYGLDGKSLAKFAQEVHSLEN